MKKIANFIFIILCFMISKIYAQSFFDGYFDTEDSCIYYSIFFEEDWHETYSDYFLSTLIDNENLDSLFALVNLNIPISFEIFKHFYFKNNFNEDDYELSYPHSCSLVRQGGKYHFSDPLTIDAAPFVTLTGAKWGVKDSNNLLIVPTKYDEIIFHENFIEAIEYEGINNLYTQKYFFDYEGKVADPPCKYNYTAVDSISQNRFIVYKGGRWIVGCCAYEASHYAGGNWGVIDSNCSVIIPFHYDIIEPYYGNRFMVGKGKFDYSRIGGKDFLTYGIIDFNGREIIPCIYSEITQDTDDYNDCYFITLNGYILHNSYAALGLEYHHGGRMGLADKNGNILLPCKFDYITSLPNFENRYYLVADKGTLIDEDLFYDLSAAY